MTGRTRLPVSAPALVLLVGLAGLEPASAQGPEIDDPAAFLESIKPNVVRVEAGGRLGFGFVVGTHGDGLLVATAWHTLDHEAGGEPRLCFVTGACADADIVHVADPVGASPRLDLVLLSVPHPAGLRWRPDVLGRAPRPGDPVWVIGRGREWYVPPEVGSVAELDPEARLVRYAGLPVARGVSGAPIVGPDGLVAMHVNSEGEVAAGVDLRAIRERVERHAQAPWVLVPRESCEDQAVHRGILGGRELAVHFDPGRPARAVEAMARLLCVGGRVVPVPVTGAVDWPGGRIAYGGGGLRLARSLQSVLASLGRLETRLAEDLEGEADVWIR